MTKQGGAKEEAFNWAIHYYQHYFRGIRRKGFSECSIRREQQLAAQGVKILSETLH